MRIRGLAVLSALIILAGCKDHAAPTDAGRRYMMGFSALPARLDTSLVGAGIAMWATRADAAIIHNSPPWAALINGVVTPAQAVDAIEVPLANAYRARGLRIVFTADATDGLNRAAEAPDLVRLGRSVTDTMIQRLYREWLIAVAQKVHPDYMGLIAETNLIRALVPAPVYQALVAMTNAAVPAIRAASPGTRLYVSIQVEVAWGRPSGPFAGIATDRADFPFVDAIGLSSYPYLAGFAQPEDIPIDYYRRIVPDSSLPLLVVEGGWTSVSGGGVTSSPAVQRRYIVRQAQLLDNAGARGVFQLTFADLNGAASTPAGASPFLFLGLADSALTAKPALAAWDSLFSRTLEP